MLRKTFLFLFVFIAFTFNEGFCQIIHYNNPHQGSVRSFTTFTPMYNYNTPRRNVSSYTRNSNGIVRTYDNYGRPSGIYMPTNAHNRGYGNSALNYFNRVNGSLKSYDRFGRLIR